ncbi:MAG: ABC transporter ATP-binding protein [Caldimonas sp.]
MSDPGPLLDLAGVTVRYGKVTALRDVDLQIRRGEFVALVGANGSGKTTLLHALHGLVAHSGSRRVGSGGRAQAMVFQRPFMLRLSVRNNLRIALWLAGVPKTARAERALEALQRAGLADRAERPARTLSGGQQQRLALARAWAVRPDVLFLDEPTSNLDPAAKKEIEAMLTAFVADGMTLVMSTHNLGQAKRLATRVIYLEGGVLLADLPTERFFDQQVDARADRFLRRDPLDASQQQGPSR